MRPTTSATVSIEEAQLGDKPWRVIISRPGALIPRTLWGSFATQREALSASEAAKSYLANPKTHNASIDEAVENDK